MSIVLRDYQEKMADDIMEGFKKNRPFIAQASTGAGKSIVIAEVAKRLGKPLLVLQPSREILLQNHSKMLLYGLDATMYSASVGSKEIGHITLATIGSIVKTPQDFAHFDTAIIDECHGVGKDPNSMYMKLFKATNIRRVCGLTATPYRLEQKYFGDVYTGAIKMLNRLKKNSFFKDIVCKVEMQDLIDRGYLLKPVYHTEETDLTDLVVNTTGRDYTEESLKKWGNKRLGKLIGMARELDEKHKRVLVFCTTVSQAEEAVVELSKMKIRAAVVSAKTPAKDRKSIVEDFQDGKIKWVLNVSTMTTGFDCPPLDCVVLLRPTFSVALLVQMVGRAVRTDPNNPHKEAHVYDFTNNIEKFGPAEEVRLAKEDGWKDMLTGANGRIDNKALFTFDRTEKQWYEGPPRPKQESFKIERPQKIDTNYLMSLI